MGIHNENKSRSLTGLAPQLFGHVPCQDMDFQRQNSWPFVYTISER